MIDANFGIWLNMKYSYEAAVLNNPLSDAQAMLV